MSDFSGINVIIFLLHILLCMLEQHSNNFTKVYETSYGCTGEYGNFWLYTNLSGIY